MSQVINEENVLEIPNENIIDDYKILSSKYDILCKEYNELDSKYRILEQIYDDMDNFKDHKMSMKYNNAKKLYKNLKNKYFIEQTKYENLETMYNNLKKNVDNVIDKSGMDPDDFYVNVELKNDDKIRDNTYEPTEVLKYKYGKLAHYTEDRDSVVRLLIKYNEYQNYINKLLLKHGRKDSIILDIGANIGSFTVSFAKLFPSCKVHAFEMMDKTYKALQKSVELNELDNVITHNIGLYDKDGVYGINYKSNMLGHTCIVDDVMLKSNPVAVVNNNAICTTLDSFNLENVSFIKMDIQGAEYFALLGAEKTLRNSDCVIIAEYVKHDYGKLDKTKKYLKSLNYELISQHGKDFLFMKK